MSTGSWASIITTLAGSAQQFGAATQLGGARGDLLAQAQDEAQSIIDTGAATSRALRQRGTAALTDIPYLSALTEAHIRSVEREEGRTTGSIAASAIGSGVELTGSPLLAQLDASIEYGHIIGQQRLTQQLGARRFRFEAEEALARAQDVTSQAERDALATINLRNAQAASIRQKQVQTVLSGVKPLSDPTFLNQLNSVTKGSKSTYAGKPTNMGYDF